MATKLLEDNFTDDDVDVDDDVDGTGTGSAGDGTAEAAGDGVAEAEAGADEADEAAGAAVLQLFCLLLIVRILNSRLSWLHSILYIVKVKVSFFLPNCLISLGRLARQ